MALIPAAANRFRPARGFVGTWANMEEDNARTGFAESEFTAGVPLMKGTGEMGVAPLATANRFIGIALANGTDAAVATAGIILMHPDLMLVPAALDLARATGRKIKQNLLWAFIFNALGIPLAAFGELNPMIAGLAMALSSVFVVGNALSLRRWYRRFQQQDALHASHGHANHR